MKLKRFFILFAAVIILAVGVFFITNGFRKRTDVFLQTYFISEDSSTIIIQTSLSGSMGYIRGMETQRDGDSIYCSFYSTFGGLNSGIGSKNRFDIKLDEASSKIYFDRGTAGDTLVLQKDEATGAWARKDMRW